MRKSQLLGYLWAYSSSAERGKLTRADRALPLLGNRVRSGFNTGTVAASFCAQVIKSLIGGPAALAENVWAAADP